MDHVAFMKKEWGFVEKILDGRKIIESRWYKNKYKPWDIIKAGETIYFKNSGEEVSIKAQAKQVIQFSDLNESKVRGILNKYGAKIGIENTNEFFKLIKDKKYCILIFLKNAEKIKPFGISKKGFGQMASWITIKSVNKRYD